MVFAMCSFGSQVSSTFIPKAYAHWCKYNGENYWYMKEDDSYERRYWHEEENDGYKTGENYRSDNCISPFFNTHLKLRSKNKRRCQQGERDKRKEPRTSLEEQKEDESHTGSRGQKQDSTCVYTHVVTTSDCFSSSDSSSDDDAQDRVIPSGEDTSIVWLKTSIEEKGTCKTESCFVASKVGVCKMVVKPHFPVRYNVVDMPCIKPAIRDFPGNMEHEQ